MDTRRHIHVILLLCWLYIFPCILCKRQKRPRNQILCRVDDYDTNCKAVQLTCPKRSVIYNPDVFVDSAECNEPIHCRGLSPMLLPEKSNCFWQKSCIIRFPIQSIFIGCDIQHAVKCLRLLDWKCIPEQATGFYKTDICDVSDSKTIGGSSLDRGIIRSHSIMPWFYDQSLFQNNSLCSRELHPTPGQSVVITVDGINGTDIINDVIDVDNDVGYIVVDDKRYNISDLVWKTRSFPKGKPVRVEFGTSAVNQEFSTKGASGFIICFKFTEKRFPLNKSVCNDIYVGDRKTKEFKRKKKRRCTDVLCKKKPKKSKNNKRKDKPKRRRGNGRKRQKKDKS